MTNLSSFEQTLSYTGSKIAHMSEEFASLSEKLSNNELKTMTTELKKSKKSLSDCIKANTIPEFDPNLLTSIMSYINKIKKMTTPSRSQATRKTQKMNFLEALSDFQNLLKTLIKIKENSPQAEKKLQKNNVVKIQSIKKNPSSHVKRLENHLILTESKLLKLKNDFQENPIFLTPHQCKEAISVLKKVNLILSKTKASKDSLNGKIKLDYDHTLVRNLMKYIKFFQHKLNSDKLAGIAVTQVNLFWYTLKEFQTLIHELENLKKVRGKAVAKVETDLLS